MRNTVKAAQAPKAAKQAAPKAAKPNAAPKAEAVAKPDASAAKQAERAAALDGKREARKLAAQAVAAYYNGASLPFKAAADRFADIRLDKPAKKPSQRQAALLASMLLAGDNVQRDGTFKRGGFVLDGRNVQPETGALSDMLGRVVSFVSGPVSGQAQSEAVYKIDLPRAAVEIREQIGGALGKAALARIEALTA